MGVGKNHAGIGYDLYGNKNRENEKEGRLTHQGSTVQAWEELHSGSGRDTLLIGSQMKGWQVQVETGRNLRMESLQDRETYDSRNTGSGISASTGGGYVSGNGSFQKQILHSDYESVTEQAGFYAGDQGFQIQAGGNTHLKGAVIHSDAPAEKNRLETGTLSWEDVENRASYKADGQGVAFSATTRTGQEDRRKLNERGLYPEVVSTVKGRAESTTKAGISAGSIIVREGEKQIQPVKQLNRDTKNSLQKLATIFDKGKVQEKQELVNELSKVGNRAIHELAARKGWQEGSDEKILAHSIFGGLLSSLAGGKIATGILAGGVGEYVNGCILAAKGKAWVEKHPDLVQAISAVVGSAVGAVTGESSIGSNVSLGGTKWNELEQLPIIGQGIKTMVKEAPVYQDDDGTCVGKMFTADAGALGYARGITIISTEDKVFEGQQVSIGVSVLPANLGVSEVRIYNKKEGSPEIDYWVTDWAEFDNALIGLAPSISGGVALSGSISPGSDGYVLCTAGVSISIGVSLGKGIVDKYYDKNDYIS